MKRTRPAASRWAWLQITLLLCSCQPSPSDPATEGGTFPPMPDPRAIEEKITRQVQKVGQVIAGGPFRDDWDSLKQITVPDWYADAKLGIFIHWGVYSVPAFGSEWYPRLMYNPGNERGIFEHHRQTWGDVSQFGYKDFIPMFRAEKFDAAAWARLFKESGAKYVVPVAEHHDGYSMYDNPYTRWDTVETGPRRDILAELKDAIRAENLRFGFSSHRAFNWAYYFRVPGADNTRPGFFDLYGAAHDFLYAGYPEDVFSKHRHNWPPQDEAFQRDWLARTTDLIDRYQPDLVWFDFGIGARQDVTYQDNPYGPMNRKFAAYYYNHALGMKMEPVINYKWNAYAPGTAVLDVERGKMAGIQNMLWQTDTSVSYNSWGYVTNHQYKPVNVIIDDFVDIISKNGVLLLNIGPRADGTIPEHEQGMLREIGAWMNANAEAVYGSRPWKIFGEGPTGTQEGAYLERKQAAYTSADIRFTTQRDTLYAFLLQWPEGGPVLIKSLAQNNPHEPRPVRAVSLVGGAPLEFSQTGDGLQVQLPGQPPRPHAHPLKIEFQ
jgi:alpha-L-fucosidase